MNRIAEIVSGMGILIGLYIIIANGTKSAAVITQIGTSSAAMVKTLQGR